VYIGDRRIPRTTETLYASHQHTQAQFVVCNYRTDGEPVKARGFSRRGGVGLVCRQASVRPLFAGSVELGFTRG
jgi:hypothetical protein